MQSAAELNSLSNATRTGVPPVEGGFAQRALDLSGGRSRKLSTLEIVKLLGDYGISVPKQQLAMSEDDAVRLASQIGYPVALKVESSDIRLNHKSDVGGVKLKLENEEEVRQAYKSIYENAYKISKDAVVDGVLVQEMVDPGIEVIIGGNRKELFGQVILFGLGGIFAELIKDTRLGICPITKEDALELINTIKAKEIFNGFRNFPKADKDALADLLVKFSKLLYEHPEIADFDLNPVFVNGPKCSIVDTRAYVSPPPASTLLSGALLKDSEDSSLFMESFMKFIDPKRVAIIGATDQEGKVGHAILKNFIEAKLHYGKFHGGIYPISPRADELRLVGEDSRLLVGKGGLIECFKSIGDIKFKKLDGNGHRINGNNGHGGELDPTAKIDLAVIVVKAALVPGVLEDCGQHGVKNVIIVSDDFRERGTPDGEEREMRVVEIAKKYGIRVIGPNCVGVCVPGTGTDTMFLPDQRMQRPTNGAIGISSQSGGLVSAILDSYGFSNIGVHSSFSFGNECDVNADELVRFFGEINAVKVISMYMEGSMNPRAFMEIAQKVSPKKPIVVLKSGRTNKSGQAAKSHTGAMAGDAAAWSALFEQSGIISVYPEPHFPFVTDVMSKSPIAKGNRVFILTNGGGFGVLGMDGIGELNIELRDAVSSHGIKNPCDTIGDSSAAAYAKRFEEIYLDPNVDIVIAQVFFQPTTMTPDVIDKMKDVVDRAREGGIEKPVITVTTQGAYSIQMRSRFEEAGFPVVPWPFNATYAASKLVHYARYRWFRCMTQEQRAQLGVELHFE